jgi:hypothetical protein
MHRSSGYYMRMSLVYGLGAVGWLILMAAVELYSLAGLITGIMCFIFAIALWWQGRKDDDGG